MVYFTIKAFALGLLVLQVHCAPMDSSPVASGSQLEPIAKRTLEYKDLTYSETLKKGAQRLRMVQMNNWNDWSDIGIPGPPTCEVWDVHATRETNNPSPQVAVREPSYRSVGTASRLNRRAPQELRATITLCKAEELISLESIGNTLLTQAEKSLRSFATIPQQQDLIVDFLTRHGVRQLKHLLITNPAEIGTVKVLETITTVSFHKPTTQEFEDILNTRLGLIAKGTGEKLHQQVKSIFWGRDLEQLLIFSYVDIPATASPVASPSAGPVPGPASGPVPVTKKKKLLGLIGSKGGKGRL